MRDKYEFLDGRPLEDCAKVYAKEVVDYEIRKEYIDETSDGKCVLMDKEYYKSSLAGMYINGANDRLCSLINKEEQSKVEASEQYIKKNDGSYSFVGSFGDKVGMHRLAKRFYFVWTEQGKRCNDKRHKQYDQYGKRGVKRIWSSRECIDWAVNEYLKKDKWNRPAISRFNDCGNYELGNVKLIEQSENCSEVKVTELRRNTLKAKRFVNDKKIILYNTEDSTDFLEFSSMNKADIFLNKNRGFIEFKLKSKGKIIIRDKSYCVREA